MSIDIKTTGLDPKTNAIIEFAAVIADTHDPEGKILGQFHTVVHVNQPHVWDDYCREMHAWYFNMLMDGQERILQPKALLGKFYSWLTANNLNPKKITAAGKNFASFDLGFIKKLPGFDLGFVKFHHPTLDPMMLWFRPQVDDVPPDSKVCCERAGISGEGNHRALADAKMVVQLLHRGWYRGVPGS